MDYTEAELRMFNQIFDIIDYMSPDQKESFVNWTYENRQAFLEWFSERIEEIDPELGADF